MSLSSINDMDSHNLITALYIDALESDNTIAEPQFSINGNDYSSLHDWDNYAKTYRGTINSEI